MNKNLAERSVMSYLAMLILIDIILFFLSSINYEFYENKFILFVSAGIGAVIGLIWWLLGVCVKYFRRLKNIARLAIILNVLIAFLFMFSTIKDMVPVLIMGGFHISIIISLIVYQKRNEVILKHRDIIVS
jgi:hypothetical protein